jgi:glutamine synthetase
MIYHIGLEVEFFLHPADKWKNNSNPTIMQCKNLSSSAANYHERLEKFLNICKTNGLMITEERGLHQYELTLTYNRIDNVLSVYQSAISIIKNTADKYGLYADFSAKPFADDYGSALHIHLSFHEEETGINLFSAGNRYSENNTLIHAIGGIMVAIPEYLETCHPDDFKRFQHQFMAPSHYAWGGNNRSTIIRIPDSHPHNRRVEFRLPSASAELTEVLNFLQKNILIGLKKEIIPPARVYGNAFDPQYKLIELPKSTSEIKAFKEKVYALGGI